MTDTAQREFWDRQMRFSALLPHFAETLDGMARDSARWSQGRSFRRRAHGDDPRQWVEWTDGTGQGEVLPVVIHGGYWRALRAEDHRFLMAGFGHVGPAVANLEYRLMPQVRLADCVADAKAGLRALMDAFPAARLLIVGHSAGAHLAVSALDAADIAARVQGAIALSGVYDLRPVPLSFLQEEIHLTGAEVTAHSLWPRAGRPPVLYVNGRDETPEFLRGSALMSTKGRAAWEVIDGDHMTLTFQAVRRAGDLLARLSGL